MILRALLNGWMAAGLSVAIVCTGTISYAGEQRREFPNHGHARKTVETAYDSDEKERRPEASPAAIDADEPFMLVKNNADESPKNPEDPKIEELKEQILELRNKGKLGFRKVVPCTDVRGFGNYTPLEKGKPLTHLILYFEPANVSTLVSDDRYVIDCSVDMVVTDAKGKVLGAKKNVKKVGGVAYSPVIDLFFTLKFKFKKPLKKGFVVRAVLHDNIKNDKTGVTFRFGKKKKASAVSDEI